jgi:hypothetical protein
MSDRFAITTNGKITIQQSVIQASNGLLLRLNGETSKYIQEIYNN